MPSGVKVSDKKIIEAITLKRGLVSHAAKALGVCRATIYKRLKESDAVREALEDAREMVLDDAEDALIQALEGTGAFEKMGPQAWAVCYFLKTQGKKRGYVERYETTGKDGGPIEVSTDELRDRLSSRIAGIASRISPNGVPSEPHTNGARSS